MTETAPSTSDAPDLRVEWAGPVARFSLRLSADLAEHMRAVAGYPLSMPMNRCIEKDRCVIARLGPDEWLLGARREQGPEIYRAIRAALANEFHALVDIAERDVLFAITGPAAEALFAGVSALYVEAELDVGDATRTLFGKAEVVLMRPTSESIRLECGRTYAPYVHALMRAFARQLGSVSFQVPRWVSSG